MQCYILNFKHLSQAVLEKKIFKYISFFNPEPQGRANSTPEPPFDQMKVEAHYAMLHTKYQGPRPRGFRGDVVGRSC